MSYGRIICILYLPPPPRVYNNIKSEVVNAPPTDRCCSWSTFAQNVYTASVCVCVVCTGGKREPASSYTQVYIMQPAEAVRTRTRVCVPICLRICIYIYMYLCVKFFSGSLCASKFSSFFLPPRRRTFCFTCDDHDDDHVVPSRFYDDQDIIYYYNIYAVRRLVGGWVGGWVYHKYIQPP